MKETVIRESGRYGRLVFMAVVTAWFVAAVFVQASQGLQGVPAAVAFAFAAGFGLEYLCAVWTRRPRVGGRRSRLHS